MNLPPSYAPAVCARGGAVAERSSAWRGRIGRTQKGFIALLIASTGLSFAAAAGITIHDCPQDVTVQCSDEIPNPDLDPNQNLGLGTGDLYATTDCQTPSITVGYSDVTDGSTCPETITRTYTLGDPCSNTELCIQTITVHDTTNPVITQCASGKTLSADANCEAQVPDLTGEVTASDNCGIASITQDPVAGTTIGVGDTLVTLTVTDNANLTTQCTATVTVVDDTPPTITGCPADIVQDNDPGQCQAVVTWIAPTADDNCGIQSFTSDYSPGDAFPVGTTPVTYTAIDIHGNNATCSFNITVNDTEAPVLTCSFDLTLACNSITNAADIATWLALATATDNCGGVSITDDYASLGFGCSPNTGSAVVTFTATDNHGNQSTCQSTVTVVDIAPPIFDILPEDDLITEEEYLRLSITAISASDLCDPNAQATYIGEAGFPEGTSYTIEREWMAMDQCGNLTTYTQVLTVVVIPADLAVGSGEPTDPSHTGSIDALRNDWVDTEVGYQDSLIEGCPKTIVRRWTVRDRRGRFEPVEETQLITVLDTAAPNLSVDVALQGTAVGITVNSDEALASPPAVEVTHDGSPIPLDMTPIGVLDELTGEYIAPPTVWIGSHEPTDEELHEVTVSGTDLCGTSGGGRAWFSLHSVSAVAGGTTTISTERASIDVEAADTIGDQPVLVGVWFEDSGAFVKIDTDPSLEGALKEVAVRVFYDPVELPDGVDESALRLHLWAPGTGGWTLLEDARVDVEAHFIEGTLIF